MAVEATAEPDPPLQRAERAVAPEPEVVDEGGRDKLGGSSAGLIFVICFVLVLLSVGLYLKVSMEPKPFFKKPEDIWTEGIMQALMSYILFWTLFYDIVHIY